MLQTITLDVARDMLDSHMGPVRELRLNAALSGLANVILIPLLLTGDVGQVVGASMGTIWRSFPWLKQRDLPRIGARPVSDMPQGRRPQPIRAVSGSVCYPLTGDRW